MAGPTSPTVGIFPTTGPLDRTDEVRSYLAAVHDAGIDHVCCGDHVSFFVGAGVDGLLQATTLALLHPSLPVMTGVYLLPLRHPVLVARQLSDLGQLAPGRLIFGVGIGGEDRHEVEICGVDPATRGRRMEECLSVLRRLLTGAPTTSTSPRPRPPASVVTILRRGTPCRRGAASPTPRSALAPTSRPPWRPS